MQSEHVALSDAKDAMTNQLKSEDVFAMIFGTMERQGPGSKESTLKALQSVPTWQEIKKVADMGCGTGASTFVLAEALDAEIYAIDSDELAIKTLGANISKGSRYECIVPVSSRFEELPQETKNFDLIWSEGAIYNIGFENGLRSWKQMLVPGGYMAVSELTWFTYSPPREAKDFWNAAYPAMQTLHENAIKIADCNLKLIDYFALPQRDFTTEYYKKITQRIALLKKRYSIGEEAKAVFKSLEEEIEIYERYSEWFGYVFYIMKNVEGS